jgi:hypothetical protein
MAWQDDTLHRQVDAIVRLLERRRLFTARSRRLPITGRTPGTVAPATIRPPRDTRAQR